jgi:hypothetical protein
MNVLNSSLLAASSIITDQATIKININAGSYAILVGSPQSSNISITYQTDFYPCPYLINYVDNYNIFSGCKTASIFSPGNSATTNIKDCPSGSVIVNNNCIPLPANCVRIDPASLLCDICISTGYSLINGQCIPKTCPSNYYFSAKYTTCESTPVSCLNFDIKTETCLLCKIGYSIQGNICVSTNIKSSGNVYNLNNFRTISEKVTSNEILTSIKTDDDTNSLFFNIYFFFFPGNSIFSCFLIKTQNEVH